AGSRQPAACSQLAARSPTGTLADVPSRHAARPLTTPRTETSRALRHQINTVAGSSAGAGRVRLSPPVRQSTCTVLQVRRHAEPRQNGGAAPVRRGASDRAVTPPTIVEPRPSVAARAIAPRLARHRRQLPVTRLAGPRPPLRADGRRGKRRRRGAARAADRRLSGTLRRGRGAGDAGADTPDRPGPR